MRLPIRRKPVTARPSTRSSGGPTDRSRKGVPSRTLFSVRPPMWVRNADRYSSTSGSSGIPLPPWMRSVAAGHTAVDVLERLQRISLGDGFLGTISFHAGESQRQAARVLRALLKIVECDLDDELRTHKDDMAFATHLALEQCSRLPFEERVGHPLERLAQHDEAVPIRVARPEMQVAQPFTAAPVSPLGR